MTLEPLEVVSTAPLTETNLKRLILDMGIDAGYVPSADLYNWYVGMCEDVRASPVNRKVFGTSLRTHGLRDFNRRIGDKNTRCWLVTRKWTRDT